MSIRKIIEASNISEEAKTLIINIDRFKSFRDLRLRLENNKSLWRIKKDTMEELYHFCVEQEMRSNIKHEL